MRRQPRGTASALCFGSAAADLAANGPDIIVYEYDRAGQNIVPVNEIETCPPMNDNIPRKKLPTLHVLPLTCHHFLVRSG
jgi:hypothetical protein